MATHLSSSDYHDMIGSLFSVGNVEGRTGEEGVRLMDKIRSCGTKEK